MSRTRQITERHHRPRRQWGRLSRILLGVFFALLLLVSLLPLAGRVINIGVVAPAAASALGLAACVWTPFFRRILQYIWQRKGLRVILIVLMALVAILLVWFIVVSVMMLRGAARPAPKNATVIVLGAAVYGETPCLMLTQRLDAAARYLDANPDAACILSGGQGPGEDISEAEAMKRYLLEKGVDESRLYMEDKSTNTFENIQFSKRILEEHRLSPTVVIATQEFHQYRAQAFARRAGLTDAGPCTCHTPPYLLLCYWVRECAAISRMLLLGY